MDDLVIIGGVIMLAVMAKRSVPWGLGWTWPVPDFAMSTGVRYPATVSQEFKSGRHVGVDVMYERQAPRDRPEYPGTSRYFAPPGTPILAARPGKVWSVNRLATGLAVVLDHGAPFATWYAHLATVEVAKGQEVTAGQRIGTMGANPNEDASKGAVDAQKLRHLHFEVWYKGHGNSAAVDPAEDMRRWKRMVWPP